MYPIPRILAAFILVAITSVPVSAQSDPSVDLPDTPEVVGRLFECRAIENSQDRLACFDREVGAVYEAQESRDLVIADREEAEKARRGLFGLNLPNLRLFGGGNNEEEEVKELSSTIADVRKAGNGRYLFVLEDGARWIQTERPRGFSEYEPGDSILIKKASLGSFMAKVNGGRAVRVRRVN